MASAYDVPVSERNHLIDLARILSVLVVVVFHSLLWQVLVVDGRIEVVPWAPGPVFWAISWIATIIPVFFIAAGYANAVVVDKWRASGAPYSAFLTLRGSRLLGPMTTFMAAFTIIGTVAAGLGWLGVATTLSRQFAQLLWFAVVYQLLLAAAPLAVWLHDRFGAWVMLSLLVGAVSVDVVVQSGGNLQLEWLNLAFVWPLAHQWGIAYHRGWFRRWPVWRLVAIVAACAGVIAMLVFALRYPPAAVAWADVLVANLQPPTVAMMVLGFAQAAALGLFERAGLASRLKPRTDRVVRIANALLLTVYLWHIPVIVCTAGALAGLSLWLPAAAPVLMNQLLLVVLVLAVVAVAVPSMARLEVRLIPRPGPGYPLPGRAEAGYTLFAAGTFAVWQTGAVLHPSALWPTAAVALFAVGAAYLRRATAQTAG